MNRRTFLRGLAASALVVGCGPLLYAGIIEPNVVEVTRQEVPIRGLGMGLDGLRVAQISDLHMGMFLSRAQLSRTFDLLLAERPDLILITGDYLTEGGDISGALDDLSATLGRLSAAASVMTVLGNHDHGSGESALRALLREQGVIELPNTILPYERGGDRLYIAGVDSVGTGHQDLGMVVKMAPTDAPVILMTHEPDMAQYSGPSGKFAMHIAGHSHGGQIRLPLLGSPMLPWMGRIYSNGMYRVGEMWHYTNRGIGTTYVPFRFNCPPEISIFTLRAA
jgi:predicted MPP superfamily phosphohydrolase